MVFARNRCALVSAGLAIAIAFAGCEGKAQDLRSLDELARATGRRRTIEPRIGNLPYEKCGLRDRTVGIEAVCPQLDAEHRQEVRRLSTDPPTRGGAAQGRLEATLAALMADNGVELLDRATRELERLAVTSGSAAVYADLAGAHLVRAQKHDDLLPLTAAVEAGRRAVEIDPRSAAGYHNLALAYERLMMRRAATEAWRRVLEVGSADGWDVEAREHLRKLQAGADIDESRERLEAQVRRGDETAVRGVMSSHPQLVRDLAREELFPAWARARLAGARQEAERLATLLELVGGLSRESGDDFAAVAAAGLRGESAPKLAAALVELDEARRDYHEKSTPDACDRLDRVETALRDLASPFALEALRLRGSCAFFAEGSRLGQLAGQLIEDARRQKLTSLEAKGWWLRGSVFFEAGRSDLARSAYEEAHRLFGRARERGNQASVTGKLASLSAKVGDAERATRTRFRAIEASLLDLDPRWPELFHSGALEILDTSPRFAFELSQESAAVDLAANDPAAVFDALLLRARIRRQLRDPAGARDDLRRCEALVRGIGAPLRPRFELLRLFLEAEVLLADDPAAARTAAAAGLALARQDGRFLEVPDVLVLQAEAWERSGQPGAALASLKEALTILAERASRERNLEDRVRLFDRTEKIMTKTITFELQTSGSEAAFRTLERYRAGYLLKRAQGRPVAGFGEIEAALAKNEVFLVFHPQKDRILVWKIAASGTLFLEIAFGEEQLDQEIVRLLAHLEAPETEFFEAAAALHDRLIAPLRLEGKERLTLVAGGVLARLPFAALSDRAGRFLFEDHPLTFAPSASAYLALRSRRADKASAGALAVGEPALPAEAGLPRLPEAAREAGVVMDEVPGSRLLTDADATVGNFLREARGRRFLHFAGHAIASPERFLAGRLLLAADKDYPDGELGASRLLEQDFSSLELVTLSACGTGTGFASAWEGRLDLALPFLAAGARNVLVTLWPIADSPAQSDFFRIFYSELRVTNDPALALQRAQGAFIRQQSARRQVSLWASFQLVGAGAFGEGGLKCSSMSSSKASSCS